MPELIMPHAPSSVVESTPTARVDEPARAEDAALRGSLGAPSREDVLSQLSKILQSASFGGATRTKGFLRYIVEETLSGNGHRLKQYSIATCVLGRGSEFDPEADPVVRLEAGKLRRVLENYYLREGSTDVVEISVPKGSYVPTFRFQSLRSEPAHSANTTKLQPDATRMLVVTPTGQFESNDCRSITTGLFEQLVVELARYSDVSVDSCDGAVLSAGGRVTPITLGRESNARFVITSGNRQSGTKVRVTVRLHDVQSESIIWTESCDFDVALDSIMELQDKVARRVAADIADYHGVIGRLLSLQSVCAEGEAWSVQNAIQKHRYLARVTNESVYRRARSDLEHGINVAPYNAMMWAALAHTVFAGNILGFSDDVDWLSLVDRYAQRSFELDRKCAFGHVVAATLGVYHRDREGVIETCRHIMKDNPHAPSTRLSAGFFRSLAGDWDAGEQMISSALEMITYPPGWAFRTTFLNAYRQKDYNRALYEIKKYPAAEQFTPPLLKAAALGQLGRKDEAQLAIAEVFRICPQFVKLSERYFRYLSCFDPLSDHLKEGLHNGGLSL
jgi:adenylate cyclase